MTASLHQILQALGIWDQFTVVNWQACKWMSESSWLESQVGAGLQYLNFWKDDKL